MDSFPTRTVSNVIPGCKATTDPKRVVITTFGSLGDLHPYLAVAIELQARGHQVTIATQEIHRSKVAQIGAGFRPVSPNLPDFGDEAEMVKRVMNVKTGAAFLLREVIIPCLRQTYEELSPAVEGADLLLTNPVTLAAQLVAEKHRPRLAWGSVVLAPSSFFSPYDPPVLTPLPWLRHLRPLGPALFRPLFALIKRRIKPWTEPWHALRRELGLPASPHDPLFEAQFSPDFTLAMFSPVLGFAQPDWPANTRVTGFSFYDRNEDGAALAPELADFLDAGEPPIVFTLGSAAVMDAGSFYLESMAAARLLGRRAVLLIGSDPQNRPSAPLPCGIVAFEYAPFSALLPRAAAVVHQGGIGTSGQALRAGRPMLVVPFGFDQPDNADRMVRLGVGRTLSRAAYSARRVAAEVTALLETPRYATRAAEIARIIQAEDGARTACDVIDTQLQRSPEGASGSTR